MDYEKAYKEALNWMRSIYPTLAGSDKEDAEHYFPELKESEDERIREGLIEALKTSKTIGELKFVIPEPTREKCIAYLEKQKEHHIPWYDYQKSKEAGYTIVPNEEYEQLIKQKEQNSNIKLLQKSWYTEGYYDCEFGYEPKWIIKTGEGGPRYEENPKYGQHIEEKSVEWEPQPESLEALMYAIEGKWEMIKPTSYLSRRLEDLYEGLVNAYRELKNKIDASMDSTAQKKQDYSGLNDFEGAIHRGFLCAGVENVPVNIIKETAQDCLAHLPVGWSEEDENIMNDLISLLWILQGSTNLIQGTASKYTNWLKSLRNRPKASDSWKHSEGPVWRIWENGACGNSDGIPIAIVKEGSTYRLVSCLGAGGEKYIMLSDLEKLPGFDKGEFETVKQEPHWKPSKEQEEPDFSQLYEPDY